MDLHLANWAAYFVRWIHVIAGISWIGSSFYFIWLDANLELPEATKPDVEGELWMVHSGGFYEVERKRIGPGRMPKTLHWFKYEALFTWISGVCLLCLVYYLHPTAFLINSETAKFSPAASILIGVGTIAFSWFIYDGIWQKLGEKHGKLATSLSILLTGSIAILFCRVFTGRAAFIHVGAMFGTWMVANVWVRILPAQQKMIDATEQGRTPDYALSGHAKRRSVHNTYLIFPVLFMMLSNHYPMAYGERFNWLILFCLIALGAGTRHLMVAKHGSGKWAAVPSAAALVALIALAGTYSGGPAATAAANSGPHVPFNEVQAIINTRCIECHSTHPTIQGFGPTPNGVDFETPDGIQRVASLIKLRAVTTKTMPLGNLTHITEKERETLGRWIDQGAHIHD